MHSPVVARAYLRELDGDADGGPSQDPVYFLEPEAMRPLHVQVDQCELLLRLCLRPLLRS